MARKHLKNLQRRPPSREPSPRILVLCEGKNTEPRYLNGVRMELRLHTLEIRSAQGVPKTIVELATAEKKNVRKKSDLGYDYIWCVFDVDEHPNLLAALQQAGANGIEVALSSPSIEIWGLLHYRDQTAHIHRHKACSDLNKLAAGYRDEKTLPFSEVWGLRDTAIKRAKALTKRHEDDGEPPHKNPSTTFYKLVELLIEVSQGRRQP